VHPAKAEGRGAARLVSGDDPSLHPEPLEGAEGVGKAGPGALLEGGGGDQATVDDQHQPVRRRRRLEVGEEARAVGSGPQVELGVPEPGAAEAAEASR
jgi:hypothetical protein